jgi:signal transduction histidine kinase
MPMRRKSSSTHLGWLTVLLLAVVVAVNVAGLWDINMARKGLEEEAKRLFRLETENRARAIQDIVSQSRMDLVFLAGSSAITRLSQKSSPFGSEMNDWDRQGAGAALLIFLRGHPQILRISVLVGKNRVLVEAGWRGGVPMVWRPAPDRQAMVEPPPALGRRPHIRGVFALDAHAATTTAQRVVAELDASSLIAPVSHDASPQCLLTDASDWPLAGGLPESEAGVDDRLTAESSVRAGGWAAPSPWKLTCVGNRAAILGLVEPLSRRYRFTLAVDLGVMVLTVLLGLYSVFQLRRRVRLESKAREEIRVRELERQLFHSERLATVGRVVAGIAHEINNPLEGMLNYLTLAKEDLERADIASVRRRLEGVQEGMERVVGTVRQVLAQVDPASAPPNPVDVCDLSRQTVAFVESRRAYRETNFLVELPDEPLMVLGNSVMLGQVLMNLVLNACEAQPQGGEVWLTADRSDGRIRVGVADRGPGISPAIQARIFEPFFSTKGSTGLGLSVCNTIVAQHGGELEVENRDGGGAVFRVTLPEWTEAGRG